MNFTCFLNRWADGGAHVQRPTNVDYRSRTRFVSLEVLGMVHGKPGRRSRYATNFSNRIEIIMSVDDMVEGQWSERSRRTVRRVYWSDIHGLFLHRDVLYAVRQDDHVLLAPRSRSIAPIFEELAQALKALGAPVPLLNVELDLRCA